MTPNQLKSRQKFVKATPLANRASCKNVNRRGENYIEEEESFSDTFDTFFEYEEELSQLKPSNSQYNFDTEEDSHGFIEMEEESFEYTDKEPYAIEMEESEDTPVTPALYSIMEEVSEDNGSDYMSVKGFDFIQCEFMKKDGHRCKRQAPKGSSICSIHKKFIEKNKEKLD